MKKIYTFRGPKGKNLPPEPKNGIWVPKSVRSCDISIDREFYMQQEKICFRGSKRRKQALVVMSPINKILRSFDYLL
jgi:hypothetical protein